MDNRTPRLMAAMAALCVVVVVVLVSRSHAHQQFVLEAKAGDYVARLYIFADGLYADEVLPLDVDLVDSANQPVPFSDVAVRIFAKEKGGQFSTLVHLIEGTTFMNYTFPEARAYEVALGFVRDGDMFAQAAFSLDIGAPFGTDQSKAPVIPWAALSMMPRGAILAALSVLALIFFGVGFATAKLFARRARTKGAHT
jgi:hypothetical protein